MAEILVKAVDATNPDTEKDRRGCYKKGYPVVVMLDGHIWGRCESKNIWVNEIRIIPYEDHSVGADSLIIKDNKTEVIYNGKLVNTLYKDARCTEHLVQVDSKGKFVLAVLKFDRAITVSGGVIQLRNDPALWEGKFVLIKCPEVTVEEAKLYVEHWKDNFSYTVVSQNDAQGRYTIRVQNNNTSITGKNIISLAKIHNYLSKWGCNNITFTFPYVQFDFSLSTAVQSDGFWGIDNIDDFVTFTIVSYNPATGIGRISANVPQSYKKEDVLRRVKIRGGIIVSSNHPVYILDINRSNVFERFKTEVKEKVEKIYCRRKHYLTPAHVDTIMAAGGVITLTKTELLNAIKNKLME